jgi:hypothetical protein
VAFLLSLSLSLTSSTPLYNTVEALHSFPPSQHMLVMGHLIEDYCLIFQLSS